MNKLLSLLLVISIFTGCTKDKPVDEPIKYIPQELKDYMYFKKGTWWVYEEETTQERDSVVVFYNDDSLITFDGSSGTPAGTYEYFNCNTHSSYDDYGYYYSCNTTWTYNERTPVFRAKSKPGNYIGETIIMFNKFILGDKMYKYGTITYDFNFDSMAGPGIFYKNVKRFNDSKNITEENDSTYFYLVKYIGIIRRECISQNKVWTLVDYNIMQ